MAVKNDDEIKKSLDMLEAHTGPYDEKFAQAHAEDIHAMADRLNGKKDDLWERTRRWFDDHYDHVKEHLHDDKEKIETHLHRHKEEKKLLNNGVSPDRESSQLRGRGFFIWLYLRGGPRWI